MRSSNAIRLIVPYWNGGTWVFDDESVGLVREPFVSGAPEILSELVKDFPDARKGFRLLFSETPFPGVQAEFERVSSDFGGTWYLWTNGPSAMREAKGWLCPALFKYFAEAPERLYVRAEPIR